MAWLTTRDRAAVLLGETTQVDIHVLNALHLGDYPHLLPTTRGGGSAPPPGSGKELRKCGQYGMSDEKGLETGQQQVRATAVHRRTSNAAGQDTQPGEHGGRPELWQAQTYDFHRPLEDYAGALAEHGFATTAMREPTPSEDLIDGEPRLAHDLRRGGFLVVRSVLLG